MGVALHLVVGLILVHGGPKVDQNLPFCAVKFGMRPQGRAVGPSFLAKFGRNVV